MTNDLVINSPNKASGNMIFKSNLSIIDKKEIAKYGNLLNEYDDDYIYFRVRALSKDILKGFYWLDFTKGNVLKDSVKLLNGKTLYPDHNTEVERWVGKVIHTLWDTKSKTHGLDAIIRMPRPGTSYSTQINENIVKGLMDGSLTSFSVSIDWVLEKSHPNMDDFDFMMKQGEKVDGKVVRFIVSEIKNYLELSVVYEGYDPNAKIKDRLIIKKDAYKNSDDVLIEDGNSLINKVAILAKNFGMDLDSKSTFDNNKKEDFAMESQENLNTKEDNNTQKSNNIQAGRLDILDKKIDEVTHNNAILTDELSKARQQLAILSNENKEIALQKESLVKKLKVKSYADFKIKNTNTGNIVKAQYLIRDDGREDLQYFYESLNDSQLVLFEEFVEASPLEALNQLNKRIAITDKESAKMKISHRNRSEWVTAKITELGKREGLSRRQIYLDGDSKGTRERLQRMAIEEYNKMYPGHSDNA